MLNIINLQPFALFCTVASSYYSSICTYPLSKVSPLSSASQHFIPPASFPIFHPSAFYLSANFNLNTYTHLFLSIPFLISLHYFAQLLILISLTHLYTSALPASHASSLSQFLSLFLSSDHNLPSFDNTLHQFTSLYHITHKSVHICPPFLIHSLLFSVSIPSYEGVSKSFKHHQNE